MKLHITRDRLVSDVQKEFNNAFPFLKIEFFQTGISNLHLHFSKCCHIINGLQKVTPRSLTAISK
jgi:hypothetical protein